MASTSTLPGRHTSSYHRRVTGADPEWLCTIHTHSYIHIMIGTIPGSALLSVSTGGHAPSLLLHARWMPPPVCIICCIYRVHSCVCAIYSCVCVVYYHLNHQYHHLLSHPGLFVVCVVFSFYVFVLHYLLVLLAVQKMMLLVVCYMCVFLYIWLQTTVVQLLQI